MHKFIKSHGGREKYFPTSLKKDLTGDCVIRAIAIGTEQDYMTVWRDLFALGMEKGFLPNDDRVWGPYLEGLGWTKHSPPLRPDRSKYRVRELWALHTAIIKTTKHLTCIKDCVHYDSWDCGAWKANTYYTPKEAK